MACVGRHAADVRGAGQEATTTAIASHSPNLIVGNRAVLHAVTAIKCSLYEPGNFLLGGHSVRISFSWPGLKSLSDFCHLLRSVELLLQGSAVENQHSITLSYFHAGWNPMWTYNSLMNPSARSRPPVYSKW